MSRRRDQRAYDASRYADPVKGEALRAYNRAYNRAQSRLRLEHQGRYAALAHQEGAGSGDPTSYGRAVRRLRREFPVRFRQLLAEERMPGRPTPTDVRARRRAAVMALAGRGLPCRAIGAELGICHTTAAADLRRARAEVAA